MKVFEVIKDYCFQQGLPTPEQEQGVIVEMLLSAQPVALEYLPEAQALFLRAPLAIADLQQADLAALYHRLLAANLLGSQFNGAWFAINDEDESIELQLRLDEALVSSPDVIDKAVAQLYGGICKAAETLQTKGSETGAVPQGLLKA
ncbi:MAG: Tir chaperone protein (CesT) family [Proteobacteria bacterium]|nr:Tir chaperone protein (CesT) family [Pseudomonadota bacterium]